MLFTTPFQTTLDPNGNPISGAKLKFYITGTSTPAAVYADTGLIVSLGSEVTADSSGRFVPIYLNSALLYRVVVADAAGTTIRDVDPIGDRLTAELGGSNGSNLIGFLQAGAGAVVRTAQNKMRDTVHVFDFIPPAQHAAIVSGSSTYDATGDIQEAFDCGAAAVRIGRGRHNISAELAMDNIAVLGDGPAYSKLWATAPMRSMLKARGQTGLIRGLGFDGNAAGGPFPTHLIFGQNCNGLQIQNVIAERAKLDLIVFDVTGNNSNSAVRNSLIRGGGTRYAVGTASNSAAGSVATIAGAANLTTLSPAIRPGVDYIRIGTEPMRAITAVTSNTITFHPPIAGANAGVAYEIRQGSAIWIGANADNSCIQVTGCTLQNMPVAGVDDHALYGAKVQFCTIEVTGAGRIMGRRSTPTGERQVKNPVDTGNYYEVQDSGHILIESAIDIKIDVPVVDGVAVDGLNAFRVVDFNTLYSATITSEGKALSAKKTTLVNTSAFNASFGGTFIIVNATTGTTVTLPDPDTASNAGLLYQNFAMPITIVINAIGAQTVTVKGQTKTVNGVVGTTGVNFTGSYKVLRAVYDSTYGWVVA